MEDISHKQWKDFQEHPCWKYLENAGRKRIALLINQLTQKDTTRDEDQFVKGQIAEIGALIQAPKVHVEVLENQAIQEQEIKHV